MKDSQDKSAQAERLVALRRAKGLTAAQLAKAMTDAGAKVSRGAISNWERGTNGIVSSKLPTLARLLGCSEGYLLRGDINDNPDNLYNSPADIVVLVAKRQLDLNQNTISRQAWLTITINQQLI